jgi:hypothetical protein
MQNQQAARRKTEGDPKTRASADRQSAMRGLQIVFTIARRFHISS